MSQLKQFIEDSCELLKSKDGELREIKEIVCKELASVFEPIGANITGRVKGEKSLKEKIIRKRYFIKYENSNELINNLSDIIGIRINCLLTKEEKKVFDLLKKQFIKGEDKFWKHKNLESFYMDFKSPQPEFQQNGKNIYRISAKWKTKDEFEYNIEVQIKSEINVLWGEIEHKLFYKNYEYLLSQDFYSELMNLLHDNLNSVEKQLELIKRHLENGNNDISSSQAYLSKIMYQKFNNKYIELAYGCKLDFRHIYKVATEFYFTTPEKTLRELQRAIANIENRSRDIIIKSDEELDDIVCGLDSESVKKIANIIHKAIKDEEIFWRILISIYSLLYEIDSYSKCICELSKSIVDKINNTSIMIYSDGEPEDGSIMPIILSSWIDYFEKYMKTDILLNEKFIEIEKVLCKFVESNLMIDIHKEHGNIKEYLKIVFRSINNDLSIGDIKVFLRIFEDSELNLINEKNEEKLKNYSEQEKLENDDIRIIRDIILWEEKYDEQ